ncbi:MAG: J domain-containing protein [Bacteroides sp.]|nr:J domain-containing protein [Prevotella sp.]MCM1406970.1 J domain-containing protein [Treponema brennaborense]MCM1470121.1 J domain-containing protein [Bacteroides sp.]
MENCYAVLGVSRSASAAEIKHAYRTKAKLLHPDVAGNNFEKIEEFRKLVHAYEVLSDIRQRSIFDMSYTVRGGNEHAGHNRGGGQSFDYRAWLSSRDDDESRAKLIFFDLLHCREDDAVALFKKMNTERADFSLSRWFTREDFMDYGFILAEELLIRGEYYDAVLLLEKIIFLENKYPYFRFFFPEVMKLASDALHRLSPEQIGEELALDAFERALDLGFPPKEDAFFLRRMAELYARIGDAYTSRICLEEAAHAGGRKTKSRR